MNVKTHDQEGESMTLFVTSASLPLDYFPTSFLEIALQRIAFPLNFTIGAMPVTVVIKNSNYLDKIVNACMNHAMRNFGHQLWLTTPMQSTNELSMLMD